MNNDERIRNWQAQREQTSASPPPKAPSAASADPFSNGPEDVQSIIAKRRRERWTNTLRQMGLFLGVPLLAILLYSSFIATKLYQGEAIFTVQTAAGSAQSPNAGIFSISTGSSTTADAFKARAFMLSRPMMEHMQQKYRFLDHFRGTNMDPLTAYKGLFGVNSDPFEYYLKRVSVSVDVQEGILHLYVQARTPEDAMKFGNAILARAEEHVNRTSDKISSDQINALTRDVQQAEVQVADSRRALASVQARRGDLSPEQTATSVYQLISNLELQLAEARRQRDALRGEGLVNSPLLPSLDIKVKELQAQIAEQRSRMTNPGGGSLVRTLTEFENASSRKEIAQARWQSTLNTLQQAYLELLQQRRYFVIVAGMSTSTYAKVRDFLPIAVPIAALLALIYAAWFAFRRFNDGAGLPGIVSEWRNR